MVAAPQCVLLLYLRKSASICGCRIGGGGVCLDAKKRLPEHCGRNAE
jgi:hypothetical protein